MKRILQSLVLSTFLPMAALAAPAAPEAPIAAASKTTALSAPGIPEGVDRLAALIFAALPQRGMASTKIVVSPFLNLGPVAHDKKLGEIVAELLVTRLSARPNLTVIERAQLNAILEEMKLSLLGLTDGDNAEKVGKLLGAEAIIVGSVAEVGDSFSITARHVSVSTGQVLFAKEVRIPQAGAIALSSKYVVTKSRSDSLFRSLLFPGWGQLYNDQDAKGYLFTGVTLGLIGAGVYRQMQYADTHDAYLKSTSRTETDDLYDKQTSEKSQSLTLYAIAATVWGLNVVDAYINGTSASDVKVPPKTALAPVLHFRKDGTQVAGLALRF